MKKTILITALALGATMVSNAQDMSFGVKVGGALSSVIGDEVSEAQSKIGVYGGAFVNFEMTDKISLQPELLFSMQGFEVEDIDGSTNLSYLNVPVSAQYRITDEIYGEFGPQLGVLLTAENDYEGTTDDIKDDLTTIDFGLNFGAGYIMDSGLGINVRYGLGLTTIDEGDNPNDIRNSVFSFGLSYGL